MDTFLVYSLLLLPLCVKGFRVWSLICTVILGALSSLAIILVRKRELLIYLTSVGLSVLCVFLMVPLVGLQSLIVAFQNALNLCDARFLKKH